MSTSPVKNAGLFAGSVRCYQFTVSITVVFAAMALVTEPVPVTVKV
jgi:hypothetical protein